MAAGGAARARKHASATIAYDATRAMSLEVFIAAIRSSLRQDVVDELLQVRVGHVVGRHRDRTPHAASSRLDFRGELGTCRGVAGIFLRDIVVGGTDQLGVLGVAGL